CGTCGSLELRAWKLAQEPIERLVLVHPDDRVVVGGHADVRYECGAVRQNAIVSGRRVRMRPDDKTDAAVGKIAHRLFLAGSLAVKVDDDRVRPRFERTRGKLALDRGKGIIERIHENSAHGVDNQRTFAVLGIDKHRTATWGPFGIIERTHQA